MSIETLPEVRKPWTMQMVQCWNHKFPIWISCTVHKSSISHPLVTRPEGPQSCTWVPIHMLIMICPKNTNLVEDVEYWVLTSFQVSLNSVQRLQRRSRKCLGQSELEVANSEWPEKHKLIRILLSVKFRWIPFSCYREELQNVSTNQWSGRPSWYSDGPQKQN